MIRRIRSMLVACAAALATLAPARAAAQDVPADTAGMQAALRKDGVCPGGSLRVAADGERVQGRCDGVIDARLLVWTDSATRAVPLAAVDTVWVRGSGFGTGVRTGAIGAGSPAGGGATWRSARSATTRRGAGATS